MRFFLCLPQQVLHNIHPLVWIDTCPHWTSIVPHNDYSNRRALSSYSLQLPRSCKSWPLRDESFEVKSYYETTEWNNLIVHHVDRLGIEKIHLPFLPLQLLGAINFPRQLRRASEISEWNPCGATSHEWTSVLLHIIVENAENNTREKERGRIESSLSLITQSSHERLCCERTHS